MIPIKVKDLTLKDLAFYSLLLLTLFLVSCSTVRETQLGSQLTESNCNQQNIYSYSADELPVPLYELEIDSALQTHFNFNSLNVAHAIGILDDLEAYVSLHEHLQKNPSIENRLELIELSQRINQAINLSSLEISAVASEIDCEEERADQISAYMKGKEKDTETRLTVGAIVVGAAGAIITGALLINGEEGNMPDFIGIGAGLAEATLGLMILTNNKKVEFYHPRNALREIWEGRLTSTMFPPAVWYYLNYFNPQETDRNSLRYQIIERWMSFEHISSAQGKKKRSLFDIYFGNGGKYSSEQLKTRANMLDQLEAQISLMKQDLKALATELQELNKK